VKQSRVDSIMESLVNILIGTAIYTLVNHTLLAWVLGIPISVGTSLWISVLFTVISFARSYAIRRIFNGRGVWQAVSERWRQ
jgi:hypothetical protein